jgi:RsiW-degrading membrane proteinase PrsW (M82 family)
MDNYQLFWLVYWIAVIAFFVLVYFIVNRNNNE